ncbi:bifunctional hydroxymethylpyrimidine kinase/phosphomethylpyrimidine kinase [Pedobacter nototheniae]|uniref:bifunctional hydroxymethylpyrimidine kinase/phosphomethylpyrimidine kinase n=1 Tax=Pedobacter nototheniae TaxID=2488994 RepID=UPI00292FA8E5|nr:bifunctional hydroxymethylpyrimidine kinase/phosphomethylpyrimidine kinase [Pedobacter nototheniae]
MVPYKKYINALTIAGSDSGGGAGIQADLKTFSALGCYATSVITAVTAQNTLGVKSVHHIPVPIILDQLQAVLDDLKPAAIKIGMIGYLQVVGLIRDELIRYGNNVPVILDPVMVATSGENLIEPETVVQLKEQLFGLLTLITPNIDEAVILSGQKINSLEEMIQAGKKIIAQGVNAVLVKGGHLPGPVIYDVLILADNEPVIFENPFIHSNNLHGTGCTLSSAITAEMAKGNDLLTAVKNAKAYFIKAILAGNEVKIGAGSGPLNHFFDPLKLIIQ